MEIKEKIAHEPQNKVETNNDPILWKDKTKKEKIFSICKNTFKVIFLIGIFYLFVVSLELLSSSFRLCLGKEASAIIQDSTKNPVAGLVIGILVTVVVQSSSTSTSIVVSMVGLGNVLPIRNAIPVIMGANIGTSITSTLVALTQVTNKDYFRRAFAAATVHDSFNLLSVLVLLPLEIVSNYLEVTTGAFVDATVKSTNTIDSVDFLQVITKPASSLIVQLSSSALEQIAANPNLTNVSIIKRTCEDAKNRSIKYKCEFLFNVDWSDWVVGVVLLAISLILLIGCLITLTKVLSSLFKGPTGKLLTKWVNSDLPGFGRYFTGFIAILIGTVFTVIIQSSSVFTSTLVPLVGMGLVSIERVFPLTLGSNIGTTFTSILSSLAQPKNFKISLQISLCHTLFNITGIIIWYPLPFMRKVPLKMASMLGETSANYRWFAVVYLIICFLLIPGVLLGLSFAGLWALLGVLIPVFFLIFFIIVINVIQNKRPLWLPKFLRSWDFLPKPVRSLEPYDKILFSCLRKSRIFSAKVQPLDEESQSSIKLETFSSEKIQDSELKLIEQNLV